MRTATRAVYALFGGLATIAGAVSLVAPATVLPDGRSPLAAHLIREEAAAFVFIGLMFFWCIRHYDHRRPVHLGLLLFTALFAGIHWHDYLRDQRSLLSPLINTLPMLALAVTAPLARAPAGGGPPVGASTPSRAIERAG